MQNKYAIYKLTSPDNKIYYGQTKNLHKRFLDYNSTKKFNNQRLLSKEIVKFGFNNFKIEILYVGLTLEKANEIETKLITCLKKSNFKNCLNISIGGDSRHEEGKITYRVDENGNVLETFPEAIRAAEKYDFNPSLIYEANTARRYYVKGKFFIYKKLHDKGLFKERNYLGKKCSMAIIQLNLKGEYINTYKSTVDAFNHTDVSSASISLCARNKQNRGGNYIWVYEKDYDKNKDYSYTNILPINRKKVKIIYEDGKSIICKSIKEVKNLTGLHYDTIKKYCNSKITFKNMKLRWN